MSEWKGNGSAQELRIGDIQAVAGVNGTAIVYASVERTAPRQLGMGAAKSAAEQALREMHDALAAHFAPVLRWSDSIPSTATLGPWSLSANGCDWSVSIITATERVFVAARRTERDVREFCSRRAAEAALRALGVPFRVEGES